MFDQIKGLVMGKSKPRMQPVQVIEHQHHWVQAPPQPKTFSQKIESLSKKTDKFAKKSFHGAGEAKYPGAKFGGSMNSVQLNGYGLSIAEAKQWVQEKKEKIFGKKKKEESDGLIRTVTKNGGKTTTTTTTKEGYPMGSMTEEPLHREPTQPRTIPQKMFGTRPPQHESIITEGASLVGKAAGAVGTFAKGRKVTEAVQRIKESKAVTGASQWYGEQAKHYKEITPSIKQTRAAAKQRQQVVASTAGQFMSFMGRGEDPYRKPVGREKLGRKVSKKEAKRLKKLFGENWASKLKRNSKGYYADVTPADLAQARKERKLTKGSVDFGVGFESMRTGMEVSLTSDMGQIPGDRESDDPFNIDARFGGASLMAGLPTPRKVKAKDRYDINANFNTGGLQL